MKAGKQALRAGKQISYEEALVRMARGEVALMQVCSLWQMRIPSMGTQIEIKEHAGWIPCACTSEDYQGYKWFEPAPEPRTIRWGRAFVKRRPNGGYTIQVNPCSLEDGEEAQYKFFNTDRVCEVTFTELDK